MLTTLPAGCRGDASARLILTDSQQMKKSPALCCSQLVQFVAEVAHLAKQSVGDSTFCMAGDSVGHILWGVLCCHTAEC